MKQRSIRLPVGRVPYLLISVSCNLPSFLFIWTLSSHLPCAACPSASPEPSWWNVCRPPSSGTSPALACSAPYLALPHPSIAAQRGKREKSTDISDKIIKWDSAKRDGGGPWVSRRWRWIGAIIHNQNSFQTRQKSVVSNVNLYSLKMCNET